MDDNQVDHQEEVAPVNQPVDQQHDPDAVPEFTEWSQIAPIGTLHNPAPSPPAREAVVVSDEEQYAIDHPAND
jgi:hypothetical protein